jgi:hypothetical protein
LADIASALTASIAVDGQTVPTANLPMGNFRHLNVSSGQNTNEYATVGQIQTAGFQLLGSNAGEINTSQQITTSKGVASNGYDSGGANFRATAGGYGAFLRIDGSSVYLLQTASGSPDGTFNNFRPFHWSLTNGAVNLDDTGAGVTCGGTLTATNLTGSSDERLKEDWRPMDREFLNRMAKVLHGTFSWKEDGTRSAGVGGASLREAFPEVVHEDARGMLSVAYGHAALVTVLELIPIVLRLLDAAGETP